MEITNTFWDKPEITTMFRDKPADPRVAKRLRQVEQRGNKYALDIGCGGGRHTQLLAELGFRTAGCDITTTMTQTTYERLAALNLKAFIVNGDMKNLPFADESFHAVVATGVLHQAETLNLYIQSISELARVSKIGAIVAMNVFTRKVLDDTYIPVLGEDYTVITKEGLKMTLLYKHMIYKFMDDCGFDLEEELGEDTKLENTGPRAVLRANFTKR